MMQCMRATPMHLLAAAGDRGRRVQGATDTRQCANAASGVRKLERLVLQVQRDGDLRAHV